MKLLEGIPKKRVIFYLLLLFFLPPFLALFWSYFQVKKSQALSQTIEHLSDEALFKEKREALNKSVIAQFGNSDKFFIDKELETLLFLKPEIDALQKLLAEPNIAESEQFAQRLELLKNRNSLTFSESNVQNYPGFTETLETLIKPVELDSQDVQELLSMIEGTGNGKKSSLKPPQLIITDFKLEKRELPKGSEIYQLQLKLLKREFTL